MNLPTTAGGHLFRTIASSVVILAAACSSGTAAGDELVAPRVVLLEYPIEPTSIDSAALHRTFGGTVTIFPLIDAMTIMTPLPSSVFQTAVPAPDRITDFNFDSVHCGMTVEFAITPSFGPADSDAVVAAGLLRMDISHTHGLVDADVTPATFAGINQLNGDASIRSGHIYFDCITTEVRITSGARER